MAKVLIAAMVFLVRSVLNSSQLSFTDCLKNSQLIFEADGGPRSLMLVLLSFCLNFISSVLAFNSAASADFGLNSDLNPSHIFRSKDFGAFCVVSPSVVFCSSFSLLGTTGVTCFDSGLELPEIWAS